MVPSCDPQPSAQTPHDGQSQSNFTLSRRGTRTSFTFRKIRRDPCRCGENIIQTTGHEILSSKQLFSFCLSSSFHQPSPPSVTVRRHRQPLNHRSPRYPLARLMQLIWKRNTSTECTTPSLPISAALVIRPGPVCAAFCARSPLAACLPT